MECHYSEDYCEYCGVTHRIETIEELRGKLFPSGSRTVAYETDASEGLIDSRTFTFEDLESTTVKIYKDRFVFEQTVFQENLKWRSGNAYRNMNRPLGTTVKTIHYAVGEAPIPMIVDTCTSDGRHPDFSKEFILALRDQNGHLYNLNLEADDSDPYAYIYAIYNTRGYSYITTLELTEKIGERSDGHPIYRDIHADKPHLENFGLNFLSRKPVYYILSYLFSSFKLSLDDVYSSFFGKGDYNDLYMRIINNIYPYNSIFRMKQIKEELIAAAMHPRRIEALVEAHGLEAALECF
jgi:hypothetical protein